MDEVSKLKLEVGQRVSGTTYRNRENSRKFGMFVHISKLRPHIATILTPTGMRYVWLDKDFRIESPVTNKRFIIIAEINGKLAPATEPREYVSREQAEKVALTMAETHGKKMFVFESSTFAEPPPKASAKLVNL